LIPGSEFALTAEAANGVAFQYRATGCPSLDDSAMPPLDEIEIEPATPRN
jgi:hypothetical protein